MILAIFLALLIIFHQRWETLRALVLAGMMVESISLSDLLQSFLAQPSLKRTRSDKFESGSHTKGRRGSEMAERSMDY